MKIKNLMKQIKKAKRYGKKLIAFIQKIKQKESKKQNKKQKKRSKNTQFRFDSATVYDTPFYSIFASVKVQKDKNTAFLMLGNDVPNKELPITTVPASEELTIDTNMIVKVKNKEN